MNRFVYFFTFLQPRFMIPQNKQPIVEKALQSVFGTNEFEGIQQLTKGLSSALIFKIIVRGKSYLLRVITRTDAMADPTYYFACMGLVAEAELGPAIYYLNTEDRISITDFIEEKPFPAGEARKEMAYLLQRLHALPKFPFRINYFDAMENFIAKFHASNILPATETKEVFDLYKELISVYPRNNQGNWVSCHNDLKPENILFDGKRPWLVDWEGAFLNDRYLDLAVLANFLVKNEEEETDFLKAYFGRTVDDNEYAQFLLMRQLLHVHYFVMFTMVGSQGKPINLNDIEKQEFRDLNDRMWNGEVDLADNNAKLQYALVHMKQLIHNSKTTGFQNSLQVVQTTKKHGVH